MWCIIGLVWGCDGDYGGVCWSKLTVVACFFRLASRALSRWLPRAMALDWLVSRPVYLFS